MRADHDVRQLDLMMHKITLYQRRAIGLRSLIDDLDGLLRSLKAIDPSLRSSMRSAWGKLEEIYAVLLDRGIPTMDESRERRVQDAIDELVSQIKTAEAGLSPHPTDE